MRHRGIYVVMRNLIVASIAFVSVIGCTSTGPPATASAISATPPPPTADGTPATSPSSLPQVGDGLLAAGTYLVGYMLPARVTVTVPNGWEGFADWSVMKVGADPARVAVGVDRIAWTYPDSCHWKDHPTDQIGDSVDDLVASMEKHTERNVTAPVPVTIDGYSGQMVEWQVPDDVRFSDCDEREYRSYAVSNWTGDDVGIRYQQAPGQVDRHYILDVDGVRVVIGATHLSVASDAELAELQAVVDSITIDAP
jgi:hypothetical protein